MSRIIGSCPRLVVVIAGPTGAGKTTWAQRAGLDVLDWESAGRSAERFLAMCAVVRYDRRARVAVERQAPLAVERETYAYATDASRIYVLAPPLEVTLERIALRGRRAMWHELGAAHRWYGAYQPTDKHRPPPEPGELLCLP